VGAIILILLTAVLTSYTNLWGLVFGGILIVFTIVIKKGVSDVLVQTKIFERIAGSSRQEWKLPT
jgi:ABC-type branched-subunit amino acid transport system permease subunit